MRNFLLLSLLLTFSCTDTSEGQNNLVSKQDFTSLAVKNENNEMHLGENECDSLKFSDFKKNLKEVEIKIEPAFLKEIDLLAQDFIKNECEKDTLFCDEILLKDRIHYKAENGYELFSFAYLFESETGYGKESASFFVFGLRKNGKTIFYDIVENLIGEIRFTLSGFEIQDSNSIIWGEMYPYFGSDYGKFKLLINGSKTDYEFSCHSETH